MYKWPLNINNFNYLDKFKIASFILNKNNRWTQGNYVEEFEKKFANYIGTKYSIFVSSGSTANTMLAMYLKDIILLELEDKEKNEILFPSTTWITSVSPFIREGFKPVFIDISLSDLSINLDKVENYLQSKEGKNVLAIFPTALLGFTPDINRIIEICNKYNILCMMDNCENTFGSYQNKNISSYFTSTTSTYFGHQLQSVEGGFIFTNSEKEYEYFQMIRNHGMTRSIKNSKKYENNLVDTRFDFYLLGNNFRNTNINAYIGLIDFEKRKDYIEKRKKLYHCFYENINKDKFILPMFFTGRDHVPFSLPIIPKDKNVRSQIIKYCEDNQIESRPIISGNLLRQTCFMKYGSYKDYEISELLNNHGLYVGLYSKLSLKNIKKLTSDINKF